MDKSYQVALNIGYVVPCKTPPTQTPTVPPSSSQRFFMDIHGYLRSSRQKGGFPSHKMLVYILPTHSKPMYSRQTVLHSHEYPLDQD
jgi:hypothetical protein